MCCYRLQCSRVQRLGISFVFGEKKKSIQTRLNQRNEPVHDTSPISSLKDFVVHFWFLTLFCFWIGNQRHQARGPAVCLEVYRAVNRYPTELMFGFLADKMDRLKQIANKGHQYFNALTSAIDPPMEGRFGPTKQKRPTALDIKDVRRPCAGVIYSPHKQQPGGRNLRCTIISYEFIRIPQRHRESFVQLTEPVWKMRGLKKGIPEQTWHSWEYDLAGSDGGGFMCKWNFYRKRAAATKAWEHLLTSSDSVVSRTSYFYL